MLFQIWQLNAIELIAILYIPGPSKCVSNGDPSAVQGIGHPDRMVLSRNWLGLGKHPELLLVVESWVSRKFLC